MTVGDFINIVKEMRKAQKEYFKTRSQASLTKSKELEKTVDKLLAERENRNKPQQGSLFEGCDNE